MPRFYSPRMQDVDASGDPLSGAKLYFYSTGTTTAKDTFSDSSLSTENANPVVADASGRFGAIYLQSGSYRVILKTSADVQVWDEDPVIGAAEDLLDRNLIINGNCVVAQGAAATVSTSYQIGQVDMFGVKADGTPTGGSINQHTEEGFGSTGTSLRLSSFSTGSGGNAYAAYRIESNDAQILIDKPSFFKCVVNHNVGVNVDYTVTISKADTADDFSSTTTIDTSSATSVSSGTETTITFSVSDMGSCGNGVEIEVKAACSTVSSKSFRWTDWDLKPIAYGTQFRAQPYAEEQGHCERYRFSTFPEGTDPAQNAGFTGAPATIAGAAGGFVFPIVFPTRMRAQPTVTTYNPEAANAYARNNSDNTDTPVASIIGLSSMIVYHNPIDATDADDLMYIHVVADAGLF